MHYYPRFLIRNFPKFKYKYNLLTKEFSNDNVSENYVCSFKANDKEEEFEFYNYEIDEDDFTSINGKAIEDIIAPYLKIDRNDPINSEEIFSNRLNMETIIGFIEHLMIKAPNLRGSRVSEKVDGKSKRLKEIKNNSQIDSIVVSLRNTTYKEPLMRERKNLIRSFGDYDKLTISIVYSVIPLPLIDPGWNIFKWELSENSVFILQISQHHFLFLQEEDIYKKMVHELNRSMEEEEYLLIHNSLMRKMLWGNPNLKYIYFTDDKEDSFMDIGKIQQKFDELHSQKTFDMSLEVPRKEEFKVLINFDGRKRKLKLECNENDFVLKALIFNDRFKNFFDGLDSKSLTGFKMREIKGRALMVKNKKIYFSDDIS